MRTSRPLMNKWDSRRTEAKRIKRNQAAFSRNEKVKAGLLPPLEAAPVAPAHTQDDLQRQRRDDLYNAARADHQNRFEALLAKGEATLEKVQHSNPYNEGFQHRIVANGTIFSIPVWDFDRLRAGLTLRDYGTNGAGLQFEVYTKGGK